MAELIRLPEAPKVEVLPKPSTMLVTHNDPFNPGDTTIVLIPAGASAYEVLKDFDFDIEFYDIIITKNQEIYDCDFIIEENDIVSISLVPKGGGSGKQILGVIAMIALVAVAPYAAGFAMSAMAGTGLVGAGVFGGMLGGAIFYGLQAGIIVAGSMLISSLTKPPMPSAPSLQSFNTSPTYGWDSSGNPLAQGGVVPILYGTHRITPQYISKYLSNVDGVQYLYALLAVAEGPISKVSEIEINKLPLDNYENVVTFTKTGTNEQSIIPQFGDTWVDQQVNKVLSYETWQYASTSGDQVQSITINLNCPNGLFYANDQGGLDSYAVYVDIEYRLSGSSTWLNFPGSTYVHNVMYYYVDQNPLAGTGYFSLPDADTEGPYDVYSYPIPWKLGGAATEPQYIETITELPAGVEGKSVFPPNPYPRIQTAWIKTVQTNVASFVQIRDATSSTIRKSYTASDLPRGKYDIRVKFANAVDTSSRYSSTVVFESLSEAISDDFTYPNTALLGVSMKATDQLSGGLPSITCIASRTLGTYGSLDNPAWACLDLITNSRYGAGVSLSNIDFQSFQTWADYCTSKNYKVNIYIDQSLTLAQSIQLIGQLGRGTVVQYGSTFKALVDMPSILPTQGFLFTMGNIIESSFSESFLPLKDRANIIEVTFYDAENNYERSVIEVAQGNYDLINQVNKTSINLLGCTSKEQAIKHARYLLNQNRYLTITASWEASIDSIHCKVGDIVNVSHDVPQWGYSGRIIGNTLRTIEVDRYDLEMPEVSSTYFIQVSDANTDEQLYVQVLSINENILTVAEDLPTIGEYSVYAFGPVGRHAKLMRVLSITTAQELTRRIAAIEYNEDIFNDDVEIPITIQSNSLNSNHLKVVENLSLGVGGTISTLVQLSWTGFALTYNVYYKKATESKYKLAGVATGNSFTIRDMQEGFEYDFKVDNLVVRQMIYGKTTPPDVVSSLAGTESGNIFTLTWEYPYTPLDFKEFQIFYEGSLLGTTTAKEFTTPRILGGTEKVFEVLAIDTTGNTSAPVEIVIPVTPVPSVTTLAGTESGNVFTITWDYIKPTDFKEFEIYNDTMLLGTTTSNIYTSIVIPGVDTKTFSVKAIDTASNSSSPVSTVVTVAPTPPVTTLTGTESGNVFTLTWEYANKPSDFKEFEIYNDTVSLGTSAINSFVSEVIPGTLTKNFTVIAIDTAGNASTATPVSVTVAPTPPVTTLVGAESGNVFTLTWAYTNKPTDFKEFVVYLGGVPIGTSAINSFVSGVIPGTLTKNFTVVAIDTAGNASTATPVSVAAMPVLPVTNLSYSESAFRYTLEWDYIKPADFKEFIVVIGGTQIGSTTSNKFTTGVIDTVTPFNINVYVKDTTDEVSAAAIILCGVTPVPPVTSLVGTESGNVFTLTWGYSSKPTDFKEFEIYNDTVSLGTTASNTFQTKVLYGSTSKSFKVIVRDIVGTESAPTFINIAITPVPPVTSLVGVESGNIFSLSWAYSRPADFREFIIKEAGVQIGSTTSNSFVTPLLLGSTSKSFTVTAVDTANNESAPQAVSIDVAPVPEVNTVSGNISNGVLALSWAYTNKPSDFSYYEIKVNGAYLATCTSEGYANIAPKHVVGSVTYEVVAVDSSGNKSNGVGVVVNIAAPTVTNITHSFGVSDVTISWQYVSNRYPLSTFTVTENGVTFETTATSVTIPCSWLGTHQITIGIKDSAGNTSSSSVGVNIVAPSTPVVNSIVSITNGVEFSWTTVAGTCGIKDYLLVYNGNQIVTSDTFYFVPTKVQGSYTLQVYARDFAGNQSSVGSKTVVVSPPSVINVAQSTTISTLALAWGVTQGSFTVKEFKIEYTDGLGAPKVGYSSTLGFSVQPDWLGNKTFSITPIDIAGNIGSTVQFNSALSAPAQPVVTSTVVGKDVVLSLVQTKGSFSLGSAEVTYDGNTVTIPTGTSTLSIPIFWDLDKIFSVTSIDLLGNRSTAASVTVTISEGEVSNVTSEVIDNNVMLRWEAIEGTLPIEHFRVLKGADIGTAVEVGITKGTFSAIFETTSGVYTYWIVPIDTAGNTGVYRGITTSVSQPPDFVLNVNWVSDWSGTKISIKNTPEDATKVVLPVNTTHTYQNHFTTYSWSTVQAQVNAGFPLWLTPSTSTASYSQTFDYGTVLGSTSITLTDPIITKDGTGTYTMSRQIFTSLDGVTFTPQTLNSLQAFVTNIRYVRVDYSWTTSDTATLLTVGAFSLRLDAKIKSDSGQGTTGSNQGVYAVDTYTPGVFIIGTYIPFNVSFVDITSITVTPKGSVPLIAIYDFLDEPNPTGFYVVLYDTNGVEVVGDFSWTASGY